MRLAVLSFDRDAAGRITGRRWCYTTNKKPAADRAKTVCGHWVTLPGGYEERAATCPECLAIDQPARR